MSNVLKVAAVVLVLFVLAVVLGGRSEKPHLTELQKQTCIQMAATADADKAPAYCPRD